MMKCANCQKPALWVWESSYTNDIPYCEDHFPNFLKVVRKAGLLKTTEQYAAANAAVSEILSPEEEAVVAAAAASETVVKKRTRKTTVVEDEGNTEDSEATA